MGKPSDVEALTRHFESLRSHGHRDGTAVDRRVPAVAAEVAPLRRAVAALAARHGAGRDDQDQIALAVSEALTNVVVHAYRGGSPGEMTLRAGVRDGILDVTVEDDGVGLAPRRDSPGLGLGLALSGALADDIEVEHIRPRGTRVALRFDLRHRRRRDRGRPVAYA